MTFTPDDLSHEKKLTEVMRYGYIKDIIQKSPLLTVHMGEDTSRA
jgi:hypothetical protein